MNISLTKIFDFEAAHFLPCFPEGHKCTRMHGHSFKVGVVVEGEVDPAKGYLIDYADMKKAIEPVRLELDHYLLNDIEGLENPTAEMLAVWIFNKLKPSLELLTEIRVFETCTSECVYKGN